MTDVSEFIQGTVEFVNTLRSRLGFASASASASASGRPLHFIRVMINMWDSTGIAANVTTEMRSRFDKEVDDQVTEG